MKVIEQFKLVVHIPSRLLVSTQTTNRALKNYFANINHPFLVWEFKLHLFRVFIGFRPKTGINDKVFPIMRYDYENRPCMYRWFASNVKKHMADDTKTTNNVFCSNKRASISSTKLRFPPFCKYTHKLEGRVPFERRNRTWEDNSSKIWEVWSLK